MAHVELKLARRRAGGIHDIFVAVMGPIGVGKSAFIKLLTGAESVIIGDSLKSQTSKVATHSYMHTPDVRITLVDTPGFEDSSEEVSDFDILQEIVAFLGPLRKLNGLLYLHRISDPRVGKVARRNLRMFKQLCGDKALKHSIIVTTFWSNVEERDGLRREQELCADETLFKAFLDNGAQITRHDSGLVSAKEIMGDFIGMPRVVLQVQDELSRGIALKDTAAGQVVMEQIRQLQEKHRREMDDLREEMKEAAKRKNRDLMAELTRERDRVEKMMKKNQDKLDQPEPQAEEQVHKLSGVRAIGQGVTINPADAPISNFDKQIPEPKRRPPMGSKRARRNPLTRTASRRLHMIGKSPFKTSNRIKRDGATGGVSRRLNRILRTIRFRSRTRD